MKLVKIKPRLVDPNLLASRNTPKPVVVRNLLDKPKLIKRTEANFSFYYNVIAIIILAGAAYLLYNRHREKDKIDEKKIYEIGKFHRYVNDTLSS